MNFIIGMIILFFQSLDAWINSDDSMSWFVILVLILVGAGALFGACSA